MLVKADNVEAYNWSESAMKVICWFMCAFACLCVCWSQRLSVALLRTGSSRSIWRCSASSQHLNSEWWNWNTVFLIHGYFHKWENRCTCQETKIRVPWTLTSHWILTPYRCRLSTWASWQIETFFKISFGKSWPSKYSFLLQLSKLLVLLVD